MLDLNPLVYLINERFDNLNQRIDDLKRDLVQRQAMHEADDKERFEALAEEIEPLKKAKWVNASMAGSATAVVTVLAELARQFFR